MKTAMQELFSKLEIEHPNLFNVYTTEGKEFINSYIKFIEMEKQQIIEAHGIKEKKSGRVTNYTYVLSGEEYYNDTYKKETH
jgi:hypothetical protein